MVDRNEIVNFLNNKLSVSEILDSSNNGLQIQGSPDVEKIGLAVDACLASYEKAIDAGCQMLIVHHGLIWKGLDFITGRNYNHIKCLVENKLNLYAAHLPLDMHDDLGNNIELTRLLNLKSVEPFGNYKGTNIGFVGNLKHPMSVEELSDAIQANLGGKSQILPFGKSENTKIAIVSGGASDLVSEAIDKGVDCFITGEGNHSDYHVAKEAGINVIYLGHYHSEQLGVKALGRLLAKKFNVETIYLDEPPITEL